MIIKPLKAEHLGEVRDIYNNFYSSDFEYPDFIGDFMCSFAVVENDQVVIAGGLRPLAELVMIMNKDLPLRRRRSAGYVALDASLYVARQSKFDRIHAVLVNRDRNWEKHLEEIGFYPRGHLLALDL